MNSHGGALSAIVREELRRPVPEGVTALARELRNRLGDSLRAVLFYGSCLRAGDATDGLVDLYAFVDRYERCFDRRLHVLLNRLLPPNVFYLEARGGGGTVRCKYAVVELDSLPKLTSAHRFETYFWARFAQPCALAYAATSRDEDVVARALAEAVITFVRRGLELRPRHASIRDLWNDTLRASYRTEVRSERPGASRALYDVDPDRYDRVTLAALERLPFAVETTRAEGKVRLEADVPASVRRLAPASWALRRWFGKPVFLMRMFRNGLFFEGGVDYVLWKIERHSGVRVDQSWREKRFRLLALGAEAWRLFRAGAFR